MIAAPFTQVPNHFLDRLPELSASETALMACIYRNTLGYHRQQVSMTLTEVMRQTGLSRQGVLNARQQAIEHGLLAYTLKDGVIFWEPILEAAPAAVKPVDPDSQMGRPPESNSLTDPVQSVDHAPEAVKPLDHDGPIRRPPESNSLTAAVKSVDHHPAAVKPFDRDGQISRPTESNHLTEAVKLVDPFLKKDLKKDLNKDLKKERGKNRAPGFRG